MIVNMLQTSNEGTGKVCTRIHNITINEYNNKDNKLHYYTFSLLLKIQLDFGKKLTSATFITVH